MSLLRLFGFLLDDNKLDEKTGLTEKQKKVIQHTFTVIRKDCVSSGVAVMTTLFTQYPESQKEFRLFKDKSFDELSKDKKFQAHCANVISTMGGVIDQIHDPELMEASLITLAERHKARGQTREHFQSLKQVMESLLPSIFGKQYTSEVQEAWRKMLNWYFSTLCRVYDE